jgi:hypothetical protein
LWPPARSEAGFVDCVVIDVVTDVVCGAGDHAGWIGARGRASAALDG